MDLNTIASVARPRDLRDLPEAEPGDAWLAGGTWLFSEPQRHLKRLVDVTGLGWAPLTVTPEGLSMATTCTIADLDAFEPPLEWRAAGLIGQCCRSFLASFKIWNMATVGGNLCMALPAGPMISLAAALHGTCVIWARDGQERRLPVVDFVLGPHSNALEAGEFLRAIELPAEALSRRSSFRRASLTPLGRSGVLLIGTATQIGGFVLTVTASTRRPVQLSFDHVPGRTALLRRIDEAIVPDLYYDDIHGRPDWRRHMTREFALEILDELFGAGQ